MAFAPEKPVTGACTGSRLELRLVLLRRSVVVWQSTMFPRLLRLRLATRSIIQEATQKRLSSAFKPRSAYIHKPAVCSQCLIQTRAATTAEMVVKVHVVYW